MSQSSTASQSSGGAPNAPAKPRPPSSSNMRLVAAYIVAALLTGIAAAVTVGRQASSDSSGLQMVERPDLDSAIVSMNQSAARAIDEARQCKAPLAYVVLQAQAGPAPLSVRIRSGAYLSPWMQLTESPRRVAIPFPSPYLTGKGELFVEGTLRPVTIWLTPGRIVGADAASAHIPVVWTPTNPC
jgi:hypothetical protein